MRKMKIRPPTKEEIAAPRKRKKEKKIAEQKEGQSISIVDLEDGQ